MFSAKKRNLVRLFIFVSLLVGSPFASAELIFSPSLFYKTFTDEFGSGSRRSTNETFYDVKLGYALSNGLYFGGIYSGMTRRERAGGPANNFERSSYGASIGYVSGGWFLMGHYLIASDYKLGDNLTFTGGDGFQVDVGHWFQVAGQLYLGPQLTYRTWSYSDVKTPAGTQGVSGVKGSEFLPFLALALRF